MRFLSRTGVVFAIVMLLAVPLAAAQSWRGMGRMAGKVTDEQGRPLENVVVKLNLPGAGGTETRTNRKGEWAIAGISRGDWQVDFELAGYEVKQIAISIAELTRVPPVEVVLKLDVNEVIRLAMIEGGELLNQQKYAEARAVYEKLLAKYPEAYRVEQYIARTHYAEKNYEEAVKHLRIAVEKDPSDQENKLRLGNILMDMGRVDEGRQVIASVDDTAVKDPAIYVNVGISLLNQNKANDALPYFEKAISRFPAKGEAYYYRALVRLQKGDTEGTIADLTKFLELAPDAPEVPAAKKALEQLKKV
jgi:tetratricopeptide (TPR) repeat protein